jgi:glycosyltransferase involved in cell wall biosynthesis
MRAPSDLPLTVLHVAQPTDAGVARVVIDLVQDQTRRGWRIAVACPPEGELADAATALGASHVSWPARRSPGPSVIPELIRLRRIVDDIDPAIVHLHSSKAAFVGRLAIRNNRPTIVQPHAWSFFALTGPMRAAAEAWERFGARWATAVVCVSEGERHAGEKAGIRAEWRVIPNGVDVNTFGGDDAGSRDAARRALGLEPGPLVVCAGRLSRQKGQDTLLDAWPLVLRAVPDASLVLVGDGPERPALEARAAPRVRFVGRRRDVPQWLTAADVVAVPSRWEGLATVALEALACGRSIVLTDVPGASELAAGGAVVPVDDPPALAAAVIERLTDAPRAAAEGRAGRELVVRAFDVHEATAKVADLYGEVLEMS